MNCMVRAAKLTPVGDLAAENGANLIEREVGDAARAVPDEYQPVAAVELHFHFDALFFQISLLLLCGGGKKSDIGFPIGNVQPGAVRRGTERLRPAVAGVKTEEAVDVLHQRLSRCRGVHNREIAVGKQFAVQTV